MPEWMKLNSSKYFNVVGKDGQSVDSPSPHSKSAMKLDAKAFEAVMSYLKDKDPCHTVIMVQVQNEPGTWGSVRDYSKTANQLFAMPVPSALLESTVLDELGVSKDAKGNWSEVFGDRADEYFHAWHVASYIEYVAAAGKKVYPLPMYVNVALRNPLTNPPANEYESGGATDNVISIYKIAAPSIDFVAPDIYLRGDEQVMRVLDLYTREDNALMVPETGGNTKYLYEVIRRGIGFSPFGIDGGGHERNSALAAEYKLLKPVVNQLAQWGIEDKIYTAIEPEDHSSQQINLDNWEADIIFGRSRRAGTNTVVPQQAHSQQTNGKTMIIQLGDGDYLVIGTNCRITFKPSGRNEGKAWHFLRVEEGTYNNNGEWEMRRVLNGDQTDWGGPYFGNNPTMLRIRVYVRENRK